jgi:hypothetical protein
VDRGVHERAIDILSLHTPLGLDVRKHIDLFRRDPELTRAFVAFVDIRAGAERRAHRPEQYVTEFLSREIGYAFSLLGGVRCVRRDGLRQDVFDTEHEAAEWGLTVLRDRLDAAHESVLRAEQNRAAALDACLALRRAHPGL